ncbi:CBS domain-containing protein [soil metagenome]
MKCVELMSTPVHTVRAEEDALAAACLMREHGVGFLPVCDADGRVTGVLTERDLAVRVCAENEEAKDVSVGDIMSEHAVTCRPTQSIAEVKREMLAHHHSALAVTDDRGRPIGVITLWDIYEATT